MEFYFARAPEGHIRASIQHRNDLVRKQHMQNQQHHHQIKEFKNDDANRKNHETEKIILLFGRVTYSFYAGREIMYSDTHKSFVYFS